MTGWHPVAVVCCGRLDVTVRDGVYAPYASETDYGRVLSERYQARPAGTLRGPARLRGRRDRTDKPDASTVPGAPGSTGRNPVRVGAAWSLDGTIAPPDNH
ncbi:hypothetical protein [Mangrovihabitans endophyticus]|uniref:Uncharacterized protein n=1 Tax=Mangrovihabitans endophyticus TaxID=1751298 RepID=A0A8J3C5L5_9ACTN|nr:hypothetical protein [Mangrovihabitans endophyticus]GGL12782.1 hypothetical protein GCM10012284_54330 [Mangrovihabitans endophyticus]